MAPPAGTLRVGRYFLSLLIMFVLLGAIIFWPGADHTPKLGLDLQGGAEVIYKAQTTTGKTPSSSSMEQAKNIINDRVNGIGVEQSQVVIQGGDKIVVTVPGKRADELADVGVTALLNFRPLVAGGWPASSATPAPTGSATGTPSATPTGSSPASATASPAPSTGVSGQNAGAYQLGQAEGDPTSATPSASTTPSATPSATPSPSGTASTGSLDTSALGYAALTADQRTQIINFKCGDPVSQDPKVNVVICDQAKTTKYMLGPVLVPGTEVSSAAAVAPNASTGQFGWTVSISLKSSGQAIWSEYTAKHHGSDNVQSTDPANYTLFTLDDEAITGPTQINGTINGDTSVSGNFSQKTASSLANSLKYGALPLKFTAETSSTVSATLGTAQLKAGLLAGGIGLILVVIYSLLYYRALGLVTVASLLVSGAITYAALVILGAQIGFTLTLAGIAGFIVAVGITADSFVVLFERIKDEVHQGRTMRVAVPRAWVRARRTIISADTVSFLAAAVLYQFTAGEVRGFAFTLGMSTIIDVIVVFLFTHPLVSLLSRSATFGSARFSGLNAAREGGIAKSAPTAEDRRRLVAARRSRSTAAAGGSVATIEDDLDQDWAGNLDEEVDRELAGDADDFGEVGAAVDESDAADAPPERDRPSSPSTPAAGTAAERAAARRARLRGATVTDDNEDGRA